MIPAEKREHTYLINRHSLLGKIDVPSNDSLKIKKGRQYALSQNIFE